MFFFVYHPMKLLILGVIAIVMLAVSRGAVCMWDSDGYWQWRAEAREFRHAQHEAWRAQRDFAREQRERVREQIRDQMRSWRYSY